MQVLDLAVFAKQLLQIFFAGFFVHVGDEDDPAFDGTHGDRTRCCAGFGCGGSGGGVVDVHFSVGHSGRGLVREVA